jgi:c-di-GMP-binding flagellar brake protein YcgR
VCLFFGQNGGDGFIQATDELIPHLFNIHLWISQTFLEKSSMESREEGTKPRYGIVNIERRKYRRFPVSLPVEYYRADSPINQTGQTLDASEGGLQILFPEQMEIGQNLKMKLFFSSGSELNSIETLGELVWMNPQLGEGKKHYRSGVKFTNISPEDMTKLKDFIVSLS